MLEFFVLVFASVFVIVDSVGNVPLFIAFLEKFSLEERGQIIRKSIAIATVVFFIFSFFGKFIFDFLKVEIYSFQIAGGLLLLIISFEMLFGFKTRTELTANEQEKAMKKDDLAVTPLAVPLLTGPGAITTGIVLFSHAASLPLMMEFSAAALIAFAFSYIILSKSAIFFKFFGLIGTKVLTRIMGLMLSAIAIQFVINGVAAAARVMFV